ncbi:MAG: right-handed parallel beta-helix repeat-containing protein, partial [Phycisphaerae bacterium]|nr:right-handed parallel beta-helix repeat-containing protein [Phycisphaerae bacterium]
MAVVCAAQLTAQAANIYVDGLLGADCIGGNYSIANRNCSGADGVAYNTIQEAVDVVNPGDTIYVRDGTYAERVKMTRSGAAGNRWTLRNYASEYVWVDGEWNTTSNQRMYCLHVQASYIDIVGINCKRATRQGVYGFLAKHITVSDLTIRSCNGAGIGLYGEESSGGSDDWVISNVKSYNNGTGLHTGTKAGHSGGNITITDCEFTDNCGRGVTARYDGVSATFTPQTIPDRNYQTDLFALDDLTIWICGFGGYIIKTTDSGATWVKEPIPTREVCLSGIWGASASNVFAVGAHGVIWHND